MKILRSDLGSGYSALPLALCFKVPNERKSLANETKRLQIERKRTSLLQENRKSRFSNEVISQANCIQKLENGIQAIAGRNEDLKLTHCERHRRILVTSTDHSVADRIINRAKKAINTTHS